MRCFVTRVCNHCGHKDLFFFNNAEIAFRLYDSKKNWNSACHKCKSTKCTSVSHSPPKIDKELLDIWAVNPEYYFMDQDEDIILADMDNLELFLNTIDTNNYPKDKLDILVAACCIILYDNTWFLERFADKDTALDEIKTTDKDAEACADIVRRELIKRKDRVWKVQDSINEYIKNIVFPQIGLNMLDKSKE